MPLPSQKVAVLAIVWIVATFGVAMGGEPEPPQLAADRTSAPASLDALLARFATIEPDERVRHRVVTRLLWILSTHHDPRLRDADTAAQLAAVARPAGPLVDAAWCDALAACQALCERFRDACQAQRQAIALTPATETALLATRRERLLEYEAQTPLVDATLSSVARFGAASDNDFRLATLAALMAEELAVAERSEPSIAACRLALDIDAACRPALLTLAAQAWRQARFEETSQAYEAALRLDGRDANTLVNLATIVKARGDIARAIELYEAAIALRPDGAAAVNSLAWLLATRPAARPDDARRALQLAAQAATATKHAEAEYLDTLAAAQAASGDFTAAVATIQQALDLMSARRADPRWWRFQSRLHWYRSAHPLRDEREPLVTLAKSLWSERRLADAAACYREVLRIQGNDAESLLNLGTLLKESGNTGEAMACYLRVTEIRRDAHAVANTLAWLLATDEHSDMRHGPGAVALAEHACSLTGFENVDYLETLAAAYAEADQFDNAVSAAKIALSLAAGKKQAAELLQLQLRLYEVKLPYRNELQACRDLAGLCWREQRLAEAAKYFERSLERKPADVSTLVNLGTLYKSLGQPQRTAELYRRASVAQPDRLDISNSLAWLLASHPDPAIRDARQAITLAQQNFRATSGDPQYADTLAAAYAAAGRYADALVTLDAALARLPTGEGADLRHQMLARRGLYRAGQPYISKSSGP